jgi:hypothetical protein
MKKTIFVTALVCLFAFGAFGQSTTTNFSGNWTLDKAKSKLDERMRVESMTVNVTQTAESIKVETSTKRLPPPADAGNGQMRPGGGGGMRGGGDGTMVYNLDGKESTVEVDGPMGKTPVKLKAELGGSNTLKLTSVRTFNGQMGEVTMTTREIWTLSADGKSMTVLRESESPRGTNTSEMVFAKN